MTAKEPIERPDGTIRAATLADVEALAELSSQLGYPVPIGKMAERLRAMTADPRHAVFVWEAAAGEVLGWIHVFRSLHLEAPPMAEIGGLVIAEGARGRGIGTALVERVERWACEPGLGSIRVRSRIERADAHRFYEKLGYTRFKRQQVFQKESASGE